MASVADLVVASGSIQAGRLYIRNRRHFDQQIAQMRDGWEVEVSIQRRRATRSLQQNKFYWSQVVGLVAEHTGYTPDEIHDIYKAKFIPKRLALNNGNGEIVGEFVLGGSTRLPNTVEFGEYCEAIRQWAAETLDVVIPDPEGAF